MAVSINIKSGKSFCELIPLDDLGLTGLSGLGKELLAGLKDPTKHEIYYQAGCFDVLVRLTSVDEYFIARFTTKVVGALLQGTLALQPKKEFLSSAKFLLTKAVTFLEKDGKAFGGSNEHGTHAGLKTALLGGNYYYTFLESVKDTAACPTMHKPSAVLAIKTKTEDTLGVKPLNIEPTAGYDANAGAATTEVDLGYGIKAVSKVVPIVVGAEHSKAPVVRLRVATALGQRVLGTTEGSVYLVSAIGKKFNVAHRVNGNKLSVRLEHKLNAAVKKTAALVSDLEKTGLNVQYGDSEDMKHASIHFESVDVQDMRRLLGAIIAELATIDHLEIDLKIKGQSCYT